MLSVNVRFITILKPILTAILGAPFAIPEHIYKCGRNCVCGFLGCHCPGKGVSSPSIDPQINTHFIIQLLGGRV